MTFEVRNQAFKCKAQTNLSKTPGSKFHTKLT